MKVNQLVSIIEKVVPPEWALPKDPIGLLVGDPGQEVTSVFAGLELSTPMLKQAMSKKANMILVHHPLIYRPLSCLLETDSVQKLVRDLTRHDISLYAAHTNFDLHPQGMAKIWAEKLGCVIYAALEPKPQVAQLKIVTFVPPTHTNVIRKALGEAGAGIIGEYDHCSYTLRGNGTFRGSEASDPYLGKAGQFENEVEDRIEIILPANRKKAIVQALCEAHPYEEPAYDLYPLVDQHGIGQAVWIAEFSKKLSWPEFEKCIKKSLPKLSHIGGVCPDKKRKIKKIAISTGSGDSVVGLAASLGVDAYLTGEVGYHLLWEAEERGLNVAVVGHGYSESFFAEAIIPLLEKQTEGVRWHSES